MRLSHYLSSSVSLWITHFTLYANGTSIWFPYEVGGPFLSRLESFRSVPLPVEHSPPRVPESPRCFRSLFKPPSTVESDLSEPPVVINQDKQAFEYFKTAYSNLEASYPHRKFILQQSIAYLVRKESISLEHLELWCRELLNIAENHPTGDEMSIIMHGFNTLILKHFGKTDVTRKLGSFMPMSPLRFLPSQEVVGDFQALDREIIAPGTGLSKALLSWSNLHAQLLHEPWLKILIEAMSEQDFKKVYQFLPVISNIFFRGAEPIPKQHSSYTRVAAIAFLFHAMHTHHDRVDELAHRMAQDILDQERRFFLFLHERILLHKLFTDFHNKKPNQQMPIP